ncbi:nitroreductase family deazaflavin-dependent oxidoreductase [Agromyces sp. MMS24-JH15]|uniref:nitroreductase family deazaflavin-dependent oxidoreductase n=1 Tax=Agromyces sp. MMS24-JH15 TaxID=3243765 RepID=UPI00374A869B
MDDAKTPRTYRHGPARRAVNRIMTAFARRGLVPASAILTTRGNRTGEPRSTPVTPIDVDGRHWLVAPYGEVAWVRNVRVDPAVTLTKGRSVRRFTLREVEPAVAGPVLRRYVRVAPIVLPYFAAEKDAPIEAFIAEADKHPVFELVEES